MGRTFREARRAAERQFPVRVRVAVPPEGLGRQLAVMHAWLDETCGDEGWQSAPAGFDGIVNDAIAFYFADAAFAQAFVARFCCGYRAETAAGAFVMRAAPSAPRRAAVAHKTP